MADSWWKDRLSGLLKWWTVTKPAIQNECKDCRLDSIDYLWWIPVGKKLRVWCWWGWIQRCRMMPLPRVEHTWEGGEFSWQERTLVWSHIHEVSVWKCCSRMSPVGKIDVRVFKEGFVGLFFGGGGLQFSKCARVDHISICCVGEV